MISTFRTLTFASAAIAGVRALSAPARSSGPKLTMSAISYKSAFMFPGQGAQTVGMAGQVCSDLPAAKALFDKASSILGYDLLQTCVEGPKEKLVHYIIYLQLQCYT